MDVPSIRYCKAVFAYASVKLIVVTLLRSEVERDDPKLMLTLEAEAGSYSLWLEAGLFPP
jgi:hypothetical protein